jgi:hypothetical protein
MESFDRFRSGETASDFLARCCTSRSKFFNEVVEPLAYALPQIKRYGCLIVPKATTADIQRAFEKDVVIIFSHWAAQHLEVNGTLVGDETICDLVPAHYSGIIDICACQPDDHLVVGIKKKSPGATVKCTLTKITPAYWIEIIQLTLHLLHKHRLNYREASQLVIRQLFRHYHSSKK